MTGIKFPKYHIASSVVNRILNVADELGMPSELEVREPPNVPDADAMGNAIDAAATTPVPALEGEGDPVTGTVARGDNLIDSI